MTGGILLLLSAVFMQSNPSGSAPRFEQPTPQPDTITVPFEYYKQHIFVSLTVNGVPGMQFLLDTGTSTNILDLQAVQTLGLKPENLQKVKNIGLGGGKVAIAAAKNLDVELDHMQVEHVLAVVDLHGLEVSFGHRTDGILGFDLLRHYVVQLDFQRQTLTLSPIKGYHYRGSGDILFLADKKHSPDVHVTLNTSTNQRQQAVVGVDTGSDVTLLLYSKFAQSAHLEGTFLPSHGLRAYGLGGFFPVQQGTLHSLSMGHLLATNMTIFLLPVTPTMIKKKTTCGVVGMSYLSNFQKVIFDVARGRMILELKPAHQISSAALPTVPPQTHLPQ